MSNAVAASVETTLRKPHHLFRVDGPFRFGEFGVLRIHASV